MKRGGGFGIAVWVVSSAATASPRAIVTTEAGITGCLSSGELAARVESAFAGAEAPPLDQTLRVSVGRLESGGLVADVRWTSSARETPRRVLESESDDCRQLDDAIPLVARALWEAESGAEPPPPDKPLDAAPAPVPMPQPAPPLPATGTATVPPPDAAPRIPSASSPLQIAFGGAAVLGVLDETAVGLRAEARMPFGRAWALRVAATRLTDGRVARVDGGRARFSAITGRAAGCWVVPSAVSVDACLGVEAGALLPRLSQVARADEDARPLLWPVALVAGRFPLVGPLAAQVSVAAGPALLKQDFYLLDARGDRQPVLRSTPVLMEAGFSLAVELW